MQKVLEELKKINQRLDNIEYDIKAEKLAKQVEKQLNPPPNPWTYPPYPNAIVTYM